MLLYLRELPQESDMLEGLMGDLGLTRELDQVDLSRKKIKSCKTAHHTSAKQRVFDLLTAARTIV